MKRVVLFVLLLGGVQNTLQAKPDGSGGGGGGKTGGGGGGGGKGGGKGGGGDTLEPAYTEVPVMFDDFSGSSLNMDNWGVELTMTGGYNWEFQAYTNDQKNLYLQDGNLIIKPTLTIEDDRYNETLLTTGVMNMTELFGGCTNADNYGCYREGQYGMLPTIWSAKVNSKHPIKYGRIEVVAKSAGGEWLWPAIWMLPVTNTYGTWPSSGEIDILEQRGNQKCRSPDGVNHGSNVTTATLHWGTSPSTNKYAQTSSRSEFQDSLADGFHTYVMNWTKTAITVSIDGTIALNISVGTDTLASKYNAQPNIWSGGEPMAPFDQPFYLMMNVACGGVNHFFPDDWSYTTPKPWSNGSPQANADFWSGFDNWHPTWVNDRVAMIVDSVNIVEYQYPAA